MKGVLIKVNVPAGTLWVQMTGALFTHTDLTGQPG